ncbi:MAG: tetratricopeptide repeat protein, partial [Planctomycetota bacterium]|nr:tetratricopeptide repeat protein [Planctomycetota bacterium]
LHGEDYSEKGLRDLLQALAKVGEAISYAHSENIVHRDLKPENIMIGRFGEVLVMDWGVAKDLNREDGVDSVQLFENVVSEMELSKIGVTLSGAVVGTPGYMSPEQLEGNCVPQSDVFSLGLILTEILTGEKAVRGNSAIERVAATASGNAMAPRKIDRSVAKELDFLVTKATKIQWPSRLGSAAQFTENLQAYLVGDEMPIYPYSMWDRFFRWSSRYPGWLVGVAFTVLLLSVSTSVYSLVAKSEKDRAKALNIAKEAQSSEKNLKAALTKIEEVDNLVKRGVPRERIEAGIETALVLGGDNYSVLLSAARVCRLGGLSRIEKRVLNKAIDDFPPAYEALFMLHEIQLKEGKRDELRVLTKAGKRLSKRAQKRGEKNEFTVVLDAVQCMRTKEYKKGLKILENFERYSESFAPGYLLRAMFHVDLNDYESALRELNQAIKYEKSDSKYYHNRGSVYSGLGKKKEAIADYTESIRLDPKLWLPYTNRGRLRIELGDLEGGKADFAKAIEVNPESTDPLVERGNSRYLRGDDDGAFEDFEAAIVLDPECKGAYFGRSKVYLRRKAYPLALADSNKALELAPEMANGYLLRGIIHEICGRSIMAIEDYSTSLKYRPFMASALKNRARVHLGRGEPTKALESYSSLISADPTVEHYLLKIAVLLKEKDYKSALEDCDLALKLDKNKDLAKIYYQRAAIYKILDNTAAVERNLRDALKADPSYVPALFRLGYLFYLKNNLAEALQQYQLVLKYDPKFALAYYGRGQVKERQGLYQKAGLDFEQFIRFAPRDKLAPSLRGLVQQYLSRPCRY